MSASKLQVDALEMPASTSFSADSSRSQRGPRQQLQGAKVCHLSPVERLGDERAFSRESLPTLRYGLRPAIIGPHSQEGLVHNVEFIPIPKSRSRIRRIVTAVRIFFQALKQRAALYHVHNPELIPVALALKLFFRKCVVYDTREDFPSMMLTKTYLPKTLRAPMSRLVAVAERTAARFLDGVITADPGSLRPLARLGKSKKLVFYNFPNLEYFPQPRSASRFYDLVYRGGLSERAGTFVLFEAVRLLLQRGIPARLLIFGYTDNQQAEKAIRDTLRTLGIEHLVTLRGVISHDRMAATLSRARIAVCPLQKIPKFMNNIPVKVFESWACGLPVVATDLPPIRPFFGARELGLLVKPGDPHALANAIQYFLSSPELLNEFGCRARRVVLERYNADVEISKLVRFYERILAC
jgi:glycosyltransferase involved in cell wall biosynthesis